MRKKIDILILFIVLVIGGFAALNAQAIGDWVHLVRYEPPSKIAELAESASMSEKGTKLFYRFSPQLVSESEVKTLCGEHALGCAVDQNIYIQEYSSQREFNESTVTAAHEMLHIAYSRLSDKEEAKLESLIDTELKKPTNKELLHKISNYPETDYYNEAHSFIGTEVKNISPELESHYKYYLTNREQLIMLFLNSPK